MKEPERLLRSGATDFERTLLESVQHERPAPELTARMERALGIALASGLSAAAASTAHAATQATVAHGSVAPPAASFAASNVAATHAAAGKVVAGKLLAGKLGAQIASGLALKVGIGAVVATGVAVSAVSFLPSAGSRAPEPSKAVAPSAPSESVQPAPRVVDPANAPALREEIELLDRARAALARGDAPAARSALERYRDSFPRGALLREARVLWAGLGAGPWPSGASPSSSATEGAPRH